MHNRGIVSAAGIGQREGRSKNIQGGWLLSYRSMLPVRCASRPGTIIVPDRRFFSKIAGSPRCPFDSAPVRSLSGVSTSGSASMLGGADRSTVAAGLAFSAGAGQQCRNSSPDRRRDPRVPGRGWNRPRVTPASGAEPDNGNRDVQADGQQLSYVRSGWNIRVAGLSPDDLAVAV